ncbi:hypothetical protein Sp245p_26025 (plasmid) [Azospirillum baldaniorum]|uniref:Uncharacterized protein n=1 Tax=Azospirillum baldaniorum TaxID=1064539 RepID=A0A9P1JZS1_9PROT|nr:hypothetical protein [Azospirillum baldaniorum]AWJ93285.1 hypothetical protein Sp245p_26025 [Azospirillum baldaniorum]TWA77979.1 hypothetical protein FBZ85_106139 [Azospirillum brasilense]CCD02921.1 exported protein of unknown function [Azospirillum baldaniorum]
MALSKARREQSAALQAMIAPLHAQGLTSAEIGKRIGTSSRTVGNHLALMGLKGNGSALRIPKTLRRSLAVVQPRQEEDDAPPGPEWIMSRAEIVAKEQAKKHLIRAMGDRPTEAQTRQLFEVSHRLDLDRRARSALRRISQ